MSLPNYDLSNVKSNSKRVYEAGEYPFVVVEAVQKVAKNGTEYTKLKLAVNVGAPKEITVYDGMFYSEKSLFRIKQFVEATGCNPPKEPDDYVGQSGWAMFKPNDEGYLEVRWFIHKDRTKDKVAPEKKEASVTANADDDSIPF